jgi:hypothetical protein
MFRFLIDLQILLLLSVVLFMLFMKIRLFVQKFADNDKYRPIYKYRHRDYESLACLFS